MSYSDSPPTHTSPDAEASFNPRVRDPKLTVVVLLDESGPDPLNLFPSEHETLLEEPSGVAIGGFTSHEQSLCEYFSASESKRSAPAQHPPFVSSHRRERVSVGPGWVKIEAIASALGRWVTVATALCANRFRIGVRLAAVRIHNIAVRAVAFERSLHLQLSRALATRATMNARLVILAVVMIVATSYGLREMSARRSSQRIDPADVANAGGGAPLIAPLPADFIRPTERLRTAVQPVTAPRSPTAAGKPTNQTHDAAAIRAVVNRYRDAMSTSDVQAVQAVWPRTDVNAVRREFARGEQNLDFEACRVSSTGTSANVSCVGVIESGFRPGQRRPRLEKRRWEFTLHKVGTGWIIAGLNSR